MNPVGRGIGSVHWVAVERELHLVQFCWDRGDSVGVRPDPGEIADSFGGGGDLILVSWGSEVTAGQFERGAEGERGRLE